MVDQNSDCSTNELSDDDNESRSCKCDFSSRTNQQNSHYNLIDSITNTNDSKEIEGMKNLLEDFRQRVCCLKDMNQKLKSELDKSMQSNFFLEQYLTCPYIEREGKITFPGKSDLDKRIDGIFVKLSNIKNDLKVAQNDKYLVRTLDNVLNLPLPSCSNHCHTNINNI